MAKTLPNMAKTLPNMVSNPSQVENAFYEHPAVMECAAFGLPDARLGEVVAVLVLLKQGRRGVPVKPLGLEAATSGL